MTDKGNHQEHPPSANLDPVARAIAFDWMLQAVEQGDPDGMLECWKCRQWRPELPGNDNESCPYCGASFIPF